VTARTLLADLRSRGVELAVEGEHLRWRAPRGALAPADLEALRRAKPDLLRLLRPQPAGPARCAGCGATYPGHPGALCFACDFGVSALPPSRAMPFLLALREERGPAGRRSVRDAELRAWLKRERQAQRDLESDQVSWLEEAEPQGSA